MAMTDDGTITLNTDDGDVEFKVTTVFEHVFKGDERNYIALTPINSAGEPEIQLYTFIEKENGIEIRDIIDDREFDEASDVLDNILEGDDNDC